MKFAIGFNLKNEQEIFKTEAEGYQATSVYQKPLIFKDKKVLLDNQEIMTVEDARAA